LDLLENPSLLGKKSGFDLVKMVEPFNHIKIGFSQFKTII